MGVFHLLRPNVDYLLAPAIGVHYDQPGKTALIGDVRDALSVRRPAGMKIIVVAKRQLVRRAAVNRKHVQMIELIGSATRGCVNESFTVERNIGTRSEEALLSQYGRGLRMPFASAGVRQIWPDPSGTLRLESKSSDFPSGVHAGSP